MNTVTIGVSPLTDARERLAAAFRGKSQGARISFENEELLWQTLNSKRWALLKAIAGKGPLSVREIARRLERDVHAVHNDVQRLVKTGILERTEDGQVVFPYEAIHVDFTLRAVA